MSFIKAAIIFALLGVSQANPAPVILQTDDVLVVRDDGSPAVMKYWEYDIQEAKAEVARRKTGIPRFRAPAGKKLTDRCEESTEVQVLSDTHFTNWDVTMSPVIENTGAGASVSVTQGYSIQNSITVRTALVRTQYHRARGLISINLFSRSANPSRYQLRTFCLRPTRSRSASLGPQPTRRRTCSPCQQGSGVLSLATRTPVGSPATWCRAALTPLPRKSSRRTATPRSRTEICPGSPGRSGSATAALTPCRTVWALERTLEVPEIRDGVLLFLKKGLLGGKDHSMQDLNRRVPGEVVSISTM